MQIVTITEEGDQNPGIRAASEATKSEFENKYITSTEVMERMGVSRFVVFTERHVGRLPPAITFPGGTCFWDRELIEPYLVAWRKRLDKREARRAFNRLVAR